MRIIDYFDNGVKYYPDNTAFIDIDDGGASMSYAQAQPHTHRIAAAMHANGYPQIASRCRRVHPYFAASVADSGP